MPPKRPHAVLGPGASCGGALDLSVDGPAHPASGISSPVILRKHVGQLVPRRHGSTEYSLQALLAGTSHELVRHVATRRIPSRRERSGLSVEGKGDPNGTG